MPQVQMIDVRQAVAAAIDYVKGFADLLPTKDVRLEETELSDQQGVWRITLSFLENQIIGSRSYKIFEIDALDGSVKSMKARSFLSGPTGYTGPSGPRP
ncbi:hypothetical protein LJR220_006788 [Bradyrhizobium sp. LjRoot220]|uniref:hypothetical protein n=1 Tax=Bradyrhizobium sp. LjRoot220 TaxID=3342284 RepID=UPI003ECD3CAD